MPLYTDFDRSIDRGRLVMRVWSVVYWLTAILSLCRRAAETGLGGIVAVLVVAGLVYFGLMHGATWLRLFWGIRSLFLAVLYFVMLCMSLIGGPWYAALEGAVGLAICIAEFYFLVLNRWVRAYFYDRRTR